MADPARGTRVAVGLPLAALTAGAVWVVVDGWHLSIQPLALAALMVAAALAERISVEIGPRSVYTPSVPPIALAALLGGPLAGLAAGAATQLALGDAVWRRRFAWGGLASLQGLSAGLVLELPTSSAGTASVAALALLAMTATNTAGRGMILYDRGVRPLLPMLLNGARVDLLETVVVTPVVAALVLAAQVSELLAVTAMGAVVAAVAIAHRQSEEFQERLATERAIARRDPLTGAPNRRAFEEALEAEHARIVRGGHPAGILVVDVDRFKAINDEHHHDVGDAVLRDTIERVAGALRPSDTVARWGGDELTVLAPGLHDEAQLRAVGERIRSLVGDTPSAGGAAVGRVTVSVGGTLLDGSVTPIEALSQADEALYRAKRTRDAMEVSLVGSEARAA